MDYGPQQLARDLDIPRGILRITGVLVLSLITLGSPFRINITLNNAPGRGRLVPYGQISAT